MTADYRTYVGPYIRCVAGPLKPVETEWKACVNKNCTSFLRISREAFCPKCGSAIQATKDTVLRPAINSNDVSEKVDQRLSRPMGDAYYTREQEGGDHLWMPNVAVDAIDRDTSFEEAAFSLTPIVAHDVFTDCAAILSQFAGDLAILRGIYGEDSVFVEWGVIQDYC